MHTLTPLRLCPYIHPGQETRDLDEGVRIPWWCRQGRAHGSNAEVVSSAIRQRHGALFPTGKVTGPCTELESDRNLQVPDRWMKQKDAPEEEGNILLDLWPDW